MNLYLDDYRPCPPGFTLARDADSCLLLLREYKVGVLSLDYDLGPGEPTGLEVAAAIVREGLYAAEIYLHSSSAAGRLAMYELLASSKPDGVVVHHGPASAERLQLIAAGEA